MRTGPTPVVVFWLSWCGYVFIELCHIACSTRGGASHVNLILGRCGTEESEQKNWQLKTWAEDKRNYELYIVLEIYPALPGLKHCYIKRAMLRTSYQAWYMTYRRGTDVWRFGTDSFYSKTLSFRNWLPASRLRYWHETNWIWTLFI